MPLYCLITNGVPGRIEEYDGVPTNPSAGKLMVWLPYAKLPEPAYDPDTHRLDPWTKSIVNGAVEESRPVIALTAQEITDRKLSWLSNDEGKNMGRMVEDLLTAIAEGTPLNRNNFPADPTDRAELWAKINARRAKRNLPPV